MAPRALRRKALLSAVFTGLLGAAAADAGTYRIVVLPGPDGAFREGSARDVNEVGQATGWVRDPNGFGRPAFWDPAGGVTLPPPAPGVTPVAGNGLNDFGVVVGQGSGAGFAFVWDAAGGTRVLAGTSGMTTTYAYDINNAGIAAGTGSIGGSDALLWDTATGSPLHAPVGSGRNVSGISASGGLAGTMGSSAASAFYRPSGGPTVDVAAGQSVVASNGLGLNDLGQVVGSYRTTQGVTRAFSWTAAGGWRNVPAVPGAESLTTRATDVNDDGVVVGTSGASAFTWTAEAGTVALTDELGPAWAGWRASAAQAINNAGWIAGEVRRPIPDHTLLLPALLIPADCPGDVDGDGTVGLDDLFWVLSTFGSPTPVADLTGDGAVTLDDLLEVLLHFGAPCP